MWPLKRKYCTSFSQEVDLLKLRFHKSARHDHRSVRIPKVDKHNEGFGLGNKEGRLICRLCSGKTINRNTSWMCATCMVPLCVDIASGDPHSSCHARWHECQDLVGVNVTLNAALRERRESKKRSRDSAEGAVAAGQHPPQQHHGVSMVVAAAAAAAVGAPPPPLEPVKVEMVLVHEQVVDPNVTAMEVADVTV